MCYIIKTKVKCYLNITVSLPCASQNRANRWVQFFVLTHCNQYYIVKFDYLGALIRYILDNLSSDIRCLKF